MNRLITFLAPLSLLLLSACAAPKHSLVLQSDFGESDGAVSAMRGVAKSVSSEVPVYDLTHDIPPYNIWEASYRLAQTVTYWPAGTVFVSVVDPGVGTDRLSVVALTRSGHFIVTPDNGTLTHLARHPGIAAVREIDEAVNRRQDSGASYTFHGRDVYAYTGARLASGAIAFEQVGRDLGESVVVIPHQNAENRDGVLFGGIPVLDVRYGNIWTNIPRDMVEHFGIDNGDPIRVTFRQGESDVVEVPMPYVNTFGDVPEGEALAYMNSLDNLSFALNMGSFSARYGIGSGQDWQVLVRK